MITGMMWFDGSKEKPMAERVLPGVEFYHKKYGRRPDVIAFHPSMLKLNEDPQITGISFRPARYVLPNNFWIGIEVEEEKK
jgi:hypothetical protein